MSDKMELDDVQAGAENDTSTGEVAVAQQEPKRQPDWTQDPSFREWQSKQDAARAAQERRAYEAEQRAANLENQFHQIRMQGMDEAEKLAYQNQLLQQQLQAVQRQRELDAYAIQRQRDLEEIVRETGVSMRQIEDAPNVHVAWQIGNKYFRENGSKAKTRSRQEEIEEEADNRVDLGAGKATSASSTMQAKYDAARKAFDYSKSLEVMAEAERKGVTINEW